MAVSPRLSLLAWLAGTLLAAAFVAACAIVRIRHIDHVTALAGGAEIATDAGSPTGYARGARRVILPERDAASLQWLMQTQVMLGAGTWHVEHVDYDNAPHGRAVGGASPYRWWLALVARGDAWLSGRPVAASVERAAVWADPILQLAGLLLASVLFRRWMGAAAAVCGVLALAGLFPLGAACLPGRPDPGGLALLCALFSVLPVAGVLIGGNAGRRRGRAVCAGVAGGFGLWIDPSLQAIVLGGIVLGGCAAAACAWRERRRAPEPAAGAASPPWRAWAAAGAATVVAAWLVEHAPAYPPLADARLDELHPLLALVWLGLGELLARVDAWGRRGAAAWDLRAYLATAAAAVAVAALPILLLVAGRRGFLAAGEAASRLSDLPGGAVAPSAGAWLARDGFSWTAVAVLVPVAAGIALALLTALARSASPRARAGAAFALGPLIAAGAGASFRLGDWSAAAAMLVVWIAVCVAVWGQTGLRAVVRWVAAAVLAGGVAAGVTLIVPRAETGFGEVVLGSEVQGLIERDLAWWLASQAPEPGAIVLAPPALSATLAFHGGLRALATPYRENEDGFRFSVRLAAASSADEGQALVENRGVRYIVVPSWDPFLDEMARLGSTQSENSLIALLRQWLPPRWLRALPYQMPAVEGFSGESVVVFAVTDVQDNVTALFRLAEYFIQTGRNDPAARLAAALQETFPTEPAAVVARAQVAAARRDAARFREALETLLPMREDGSAEVLTWDQRVHLALVLQQARRMDLAREEAQRCLDEMDEMALRSLTNLTLHRLLALLRTLGLEMPDPELQRLALDLLPPELKPRP